METKGKERKYYKKPEIKQVKLVIDEAVLSGCKTTVGDTSGKKNVSCNIAQCRLTQAS